MFIEFLQEQKKWLWILSNFYTSDKEKRILEYILNESIDNKK